MADPAGWLPAPEWARIQQSVPILCVDVLVMDDAGRAGLIRRATPHQGERWCLVGGRVLRDEPLLAAVRRQVATTLGAGVTPHFAFGDEPHAIAQYFSEPRPGELYDPRQHAAGLTYVVRLEGTPVAMGEATAFAWHALDALPPPEAFGFEQDRVVAQCLRTLAARTGGHRAP